jgi:hypothetical protein
LVSRGRRLDIATFTAFLVSHTIHFASVALLALVTNGDSMRNSGGWIAAMVVATLFYLGGWGVLRAKQRPTHGWAGTRQRRRETSVLAIVWAVFFLAFLGRSTRSLLLGSLTVLASLALFAGVSGRDRTSQLCQAPVRLTPRGPVSEAFMSRPAATVAAAFSWRRPDSRPGLRQTGQTEGTIIQGVTGGIPGADDDATTRSRQARHGDPSGVRRHTGQPLRRAQVRITSGGPTPGQQPENRLATTDTNGRYEFKDVRAGRYYLTVSKPGGYMNVQYGQQRPQDPGKPLDVLDGQTIEKIDFSLPRGGVITGRVLDEAGDAVTDAQVAAVRAQTIGGVRRLVPAGRTVTTNDIGEFRLFALPAGDYFISATLRNNDLGDGDNRNSIRRLITGHPDIGSAQRLTALGQSVTDLSLPLMPTRTARVTGVALDSQNQPMRGRLSDRAGDLGMFGAEVADTSRRLVHDQQLAPRLHAGARPGRLRRTDRC